MARKCTGLNRPTRSFVPPSNPSHVLTRRRNDSRKKNESEDQNCSIPISGPECDAFCSGAAVLTGRPSTEYTQIGSCHPMVAAFHDLVRDLAANEKGVASYSCNYLLANLLTKYAGGDVSSSLARQRAAYERFWEAESMCAATNRSTWSIQRQIPDIVDDARRHIRAVLGRLRMENGTLNPIVADRLSVHFGHGPGSTTSLPRRKGDSAYKFRPRPDTTSNNIVWAHAAVMHNQPWYRECFDLERPFEDQVHLVLGNVVGTVPKNDKTDRIIGTEPDLNMYVQKGFGGYMRERLKRFGVNLDDQTRNQEFARLGSESDTRYTHGVEDSYACLDLSMASDTVSTGVVRMLLPPDWFDALEQVRSPYGVLPDECASLAPDWAKPGLRQGVHYYQKFSSMGNGFTFELESLIFWALTKAVVARVLNGPRPIAVYGDDIICPVAAYPMLTRVLRLVGFKINQDKSYAGYGFRESCGKHFYLGADVTPFFVRSPVKKMTDVFLFVNNIERWRRRNQDTLSPMNQLRIAMFRDLCCRVLPRKWQKPRIPDGFGDGALIGYFDQCLPRTDPDGTEHWKVSVLTTMPLHDFSYRSVGLLVKALNKRPLDLLWGFFPDDVEPIRVNPVRGEHYRVKSILIPWYSFP